MTRTKGVGVAVDGTDGVLRESRKALQSSPYQAIRQVGVEYREGMVVLSGNVRSFFHKQLAQEAVRLVPGSPEIQNDLVVLAFSEAA